jgi:predicted DNA-binding antitoxin AbrB/MazE fold protein
MTPQTITVEAVFENGVLRPLAALPLQPRQRVTLLVQVPRGAAPWPEDVAAIYQEIADEDRRLANTLWPTVKETWPPSEEQP